MPEHFGRHGEDRGMPLLHQGEMRAKALCKSKWGARLLKLTSTKESEIKVRSPQHMLSLFAIIMNSTSKLACMTHAAFRVFDPSSVHPTYQVPRFKPVQHRGLSNDTTCSSDLCHPVVVVVVPLCGVQNKGLQHTKSLFESLAQQTFKQFVVQVVVDVTIKSQLEVRGAGARNDPSESYTTKCDIRQIANGAEVQMSVTVVKEPTTCKSKGHARNVGLKARTELEAIPASSTTVGKAPFVMWVDPYHVLAPTAMEKMVWLLEGHPQYVPPSSARWRTPLLTIHDRHACRFAWVGSFSAEMDGSEHTPWRNGAHDGVAKSLEENLARLPIIVRREAHEKVQ
eukprot:1187913-Prorocentrum_minimum.AAC.4